MIVTSRRKVSPFSSNVIVNFGAGHGGSSGRYDALKEIAFDYSFMLWQMGIAE
jgi:oligopeptidase B